MIHTTRCIVVAAACVVSLAAAAAEAGESPKLSYNRDVRPILSDACFACHGPDANKRKKDLRLDVAEVATAKRGEGRAAIVPGDSDASEMIRRIFADDAEQRMPPAEAHKTLTAAQKQTLRDWVAQGAKYEAHWAFIAPQKVEPPAVKRSDWPRNPIDRFVLARLEAGGLSPSPEADRVTLIRRLTLDLTGLPPTPEQVDAFVADTSADLPGAYEKVVDRLLASPHFGERLALVWLDAARYADTNGFSIDEHRDMWPWRDWVIDAFNRNMPFDAFITEQIAGDLLAGATERQRLATGFLRNSMSTHEGGTIAEEYRVTYIADKIDTVSSAMMGLTMRCAQCHDHKYDPLTQEDFYRLFAYFGRSVEHGHGQHNANTPPLLAVDPVIGDAGDLRAALERRIATLRRMRHEPTAAIAADRRAWEAKRLAELGGPGGEAPGTAIGLVDALSTPEAERSEAQWDAIMAEFVKTSRLVFLHVNQIDTEIGLLRKQAEAGKVTVMVMAEEAKPRPTYLLVRGQYDQPDKTRELTPGTPAALPTLRDDRPANRLGLAQWLVDPANPLTGRVAVNRWWAMLFGAGLVATGNDFGSQGEYPSHPQLLDWLAREHADGGWDVKALIRLIVTSATYRQASRVTDQMRERDPLNRLLGRQGRYRLAAELVRDNAMAIGGMLNDGIGGPPVFVPQPEGLWREISHFGYTGVTYTSQSFYADAGVDARRRGLYTYWKRTSPPPGLAAFDAPTREVCTIGRATTNTPLAALVMLNDPQYVEAARGLADRAAREGGEEAADRITRMFRIATGRAAEADEIAVLRGRYERAVVRYAKDEKAARAFAGEGAGAGAGGGAKPQAAERAAMVDVAAVILNLDETITRE